MSDPARRPCTEAGFFAWLQRRDTRHEPVDGVPRAMVGATQRHDRLVMNLLPALGNRLRGWPCRTGTSATAVRIPNRNIRCPEAILDRRPFSDTALAASEPTLVAEVFSPAAALSDDIERLEEYRGLPRLRHILTIDPEQPRLRLQSRGEDGPWSSAPHAGLAAEVPIPILGLTQPLGEICEGLSFRRQPYPVTPGG